MSIGLNRVILIGNAGSDPELRHLNNGNPVASFNLATSEKRKSSDGQSQEQTEWHRIVFYGKPAEICKDYVSKGSRVCIEGKIHYSSWDDRKTGQKKYMTEIIGNQILFLGESSGNNQGRRDSYSQRNDYPSPEDDGLPF